MKILGIIGRTDNPLAHDGAAALIVDNEIVYAIEQERLSRTRYAMGQGAGSAIRACLEDTGYQLSAIDHIAYGWLPKLESATAISNNICLSDELTDVIFPSELQDQKNPSLIHFVQHHYAHAASTYYTSGFQSAAILVIDGRGEGESISLYRASGNGIEFIESYPMIYSLGVFYSAAATCAGIGGKGGHSGPGKLMGLAPFGQARQEIDFYFNEETGHFTLPSSIQEKVNALKSLPTAGNMWQFWYAYFGQNFYPFTGKSNGTATAYDIAHYVDLAASVQQKFEYICQGLVKRIKKLTGETNLAMSGGCALNCSMNAYLGKQHTFENIYVFPGANDAGTSIGAALALSYTLNPSAITQPRLIAPAFGNSYSDEDIFDAISEFRLIPQKLTNADLAEQVADDLKNDKIVAWFRGGDEFGPRALGRRSFMANPANRENLGRLNTIKGREMWRPLAPSILDEHAEEVLEGSMDRGLHRYMLGVTIIRPEWRKKIPAVVHIDFTCRPHFVQKEQDGIYWEVIRRFNEKTGIPLICNTSLNVAGQPIVHKLTEVLDLFTTQDDVQTLVIEGFYLTKARAISITHLEESFDSVDKLQDKVFEI